MSHRHPRPRRDHRGRPAARPADAGLRRRRLRQDAAGDGVHRPRHHASSTSRASSWPSRRRPRNWPRTSPRSASTSTRLIAPEEDGRSTTSASSAARSRRPASTTWRACSSASAAMIDAGRRQARRARHVEALFAGLPNEAILRAELRRLFRWLKEKGVTAIITGEQGDEDAHPPRPRGVRQRLRDLPGPPRRQPGRHAAPADRQVPRLRATAPTSTPS